MEAVKAPLQRAGVDQTKYNGHSFRMGTATTVAPNGQEDTTTKTLGRSKSLTYWPDSYRPVR